MRTADLLFTFDQELDGYWQLSLSLQIGFNGQQPDDDISLVVLDINLPDISGFDVCRQMLKTKDTPIVFMTSRDSELDEVAGLEMGADAYIKKPVRPRTMIAHIRAVLARYNKSKEEKGAGEVSSPHPDFTVNNDTKTITYKGQVLELTAQEFIILSTMVVQPRRVFSREQIVAMIDEEIFILPNSVTHRIKRIREKIKKIDTDSELLISCRGLGYKLVA